MDLKKYFALMRKGYGYSLLKLADKARHGGKIKVCFAVVFDSVFPMAPVFEKMRNDPFFYPFLAVIPDRVRGGHNEIRQYISTESFLRHKYPDAEIVSPLDKRTGEYSDISEKCDIYCTPNPYETLTRPFYTADYFWRKHIPVIYANYGLNMAACYQKMMRENIFFGKVWRIFAENEQCLSDLTMNPFSPAVVLSGYPKMDSLAQCPIIPHERKKIIIALHHSIEKGNKNGLDFGVLLYFPEFFPLLPTLYPYIDFIFRPHPLLYSNLEKLWGVDKAGKYWETLEKLPNVALQRGGDYLDTFANSDALIHDCGSFTGEYLYTGKPCCRMLADPGTLNTEYGEFGKKCVKQHYLAQNPEEIKSFIEYVVLQGNDSKKEERERFLKTMAINYPRAADFIVENIKSAIMCP